MQPALPSLIFRKGFIMAITNFDPSSDSFIESTPASTGVIDTLIGGDSAYIGRLNSTISPFNVSLASFIPKDIPINFDHIGSLVLDAYGRGLDRNIPENCKDSKYINLWVGGKPSNEKTKSENFEIVSGAFEKLIEGKSFHLTTDIAWRLVKWTHEHGDLQVTPINRFEFIPGKVHCYTFNVKSTLGRNGLLRVSPSIKPEGIFINIYVSEENLCANHTSVVSKFKDNTYFCAAKHILAYYGVHLYPDGSASAKIIRKGQPAKYKLTSEQTYYLISNIQHAQGKGFYLKHVMMDRLLSRGYMFSDIVSGDSSNDQWLPTITDPLNGNNNAALFKEFREASKSVYYYRNSSGLDYYRRDFNARHLGPDCWMSSSIIEWDSLLTQEEIMHSILDERSEYKERTLSINECKMLKTRSKAGDAILLHLAKNL